MAIEILKRNDNRVKKISSRLKGLEDTIQDGIAGYIQAGKALKEIRENRLFEELGYESFESYCEERWNFTRQRAHQLEKAANMVLQLQSAGIESLPENEGQLRALASVPEEVREETWEKVVESGEKITAEKIKQVGQELKGKKDEFSFLLDDGVSIRAKYFVQPLDHGSHLVHYEFFGDLGFLEVAQATSELDDLNIVRDEGKVQAQRLRDEWLNEQLTDFRGYKKGEIVGITSVSNPIHQEFIGLEAKIEVILPDGSMRLRTFSGKSFLSSIQEICKANLGETCYDEEAEKKARQQLLTEHVDVEVLPAVQNRVSDSDKLDSVFDQIVLLEKQLSYLSDKEPEIVTKMFDIVQDMKNIIVG